MKEKLYRILYPPAWITVLFGLCAFVFLIVSAVLLDSAHPISILSYAMSFCALSLAIVNTIKYKRYQSPVYMAAKIISLTAASVSMLTLENAMLTAFGKTNDILFHRVILSASGGVIMMMVMSFSVYMIVNASKHIRSYRE